MAEVELVGIDAMRKDLKSLDPEGPRTWLKPALKDMAEASAKDVPKHVRGSGAAPIRGRLTSRSGQLLDSISVESAKFSAAFGTTAGFYKGHEFGIGKFPRRAFLWPALKSSESQYPAILERRWDQALSKTGKVVVN